MDNKLKTCTKQTDNVFISPSATPALLLLSLLLLLFQLLCRVKGKGSENMVIYLEKGSHRISVLWHSKQEDRRMSDCRTRGIAYTHIFVSFLSFDILSSVCIKEDLEKKTTQHITSFLCLVFFGFILFYQNLGRRNYVFAQLLVTEGYKCYPVLFFLLL